MSAITQFAVTQLRDLLLCRQCQRPVDYASLFQRAEVDRFDLLVTCHKTREEFFLTGQEMVEADGPLGILELIYRKSSLLGDGPPPPRSLLLTEPPHDDPPAR